MSESTLSPKELLTWAKEQGERALNLNWKPKYNGKKITLDNFKELEREYLQDIEDDLQEYIRGQARKGGLVEDDARRVFYRNLCRADSYFLGKYILGFDQAVFHLHYPLCQEVMKQMRKKGGRSLFELARDMFKTTFCTKTEIIRQILNDPEVRILIKSHSESNAGAILKEAKEHFWLNSRLMSLFPEHIPQSKTAHGSGVQWTTPARTSIRSEPTISAAGTGSGRTGLHYDTIIGDDVWDKDAVSTPAQMGKCMKEISDMEYLLQEPGLGRIMFVGTRWAHDDPTNHLMSDPQYYCVIVSGITKKGDSIFPEHSPIQVFFRQWRGNRYNFSCQIMLNPRNEDRQFERHWFRYIDVEEIMADVKQNKLTMRIVILTDFAGSKSDTSDYFAGIAVGIDNAGRKIILEALRKRMTPYDAINAVYDLSDKWNADMIVRQKTLLETALMSFIHEFNKKRKLKGKVKRRWYTHSLGGQSKEKRMQALQPYYQSGEIHHNKQNCMELEKEILDFPYNQTNDDLMDCLSEITDERVNRKPTSKPTYVEPQKEEPLTIDGIYMAEKKYRQDCAKLAIVRAGGDLKKEIANRERELQEKKYSEDLQ